MPVSEGSTRSVEVVMKIKRKIVIHHYIVNIFVTILLSAGLSGIGVILSDVADMVNLRRYLESPLLFALNTIPLTLLMLLLYHLTSRQWASFCFGGGFFLLMQIVNRFKMVLREEPFTLADVLLGVEAAKVIKLSELPFGPVVIASCIAWALVSLFLFLFVRSKPLGKIVKIAGIFMSIALFTLSFIGIYKDTKLYDSFKIRGSIYSRVNQFKSRGFMYSFLVRAGSYKSLKPEGYSKPEVEQLLRQYEGRPGNTEEKLPHIIAVMGEAFYDMDRIPGIEFNEGYDPLLHFNRIKKQAYSGRIVTNIFGGGTANTEFAFLTGHSMPIMPDMTSPYSSYLRRDTFSLARVLEGKGYSSIAFHPGDSWFYNRVNVYKFFGFDNIFFKNDMDQEKVTLNYGYISDMDTYGFLLDQFKKHLSEKPGSPLFEFVVTIDNHGPYSKEDLGNAGILKRKDNMNSEEYNILNNYLNGVSRCDQALGYLTDSIGKMDEPVVLLHFADHLPYLGENNVGYKALGFDIDQGGSLEAYLNQYETPYFIWSNQAAQTLLAKDGKSIPVGEAEEVSSNFLAVELLEYIGLNGGAYFNYLTELKDALPVITNRFLKEKTSYTENGSAQTAEMLEQYRKLQYYMLMEKEAIGG